MALGAVLLVAAIASLALILARDEPRSADAKAGRAAAAMVPGELPENPRAAALMALASKRLNPGIASEFAMFKVANDHAGIERVLEAHDETVVAAVRTEQWVVTAGDGGVVRVWRPSDGALMGEVAAPRPVTALGDGEGTSLVAVADASGRLSLVDLGDPRRPALRPLEARAPRGHGRLLDLSFSTDGLDVVSIHSDGTVRWVDTSTGERPRTTSLRASTGDLPWSPGDPLRLTAAQIESDAYAEDDRVLVSTVDGAVARVDLAGSDGVTLLEAGVTPGRIVELAGQPFATEGFIAAATHGFVRLEDDGEPLVERGPPVTGVAFADGGYVWVGGKAGARLFETESPLSRLESLPGGRPVTRLASGAGGVVAIHPDGYVSLLGRPDTGLALPSTATTPVASFRAPGELVVAEGYDANHVERLFAVRLSRREPTIGETSSHEEIRSFRPGADWWPDADDESALYVNAATADDELLVAGGQDPTGTAVVLVWNARSGRPLRRLPLSTGGVDPSDPSIVASVVSIPGKDRIAAYSTVQELVAIWSTETWEQVAAVPVGPAGSLALSPDESTIAVVGLADESDGDGDRSRLTFVDVERGEVRERVSTPSVSQASWSPDGERIAALADDGTLRVLSADGRRELGDPIDLGANPLALQWRPGGDVIAVTLDGDGVVLVDPDEGDVSAPLPGAAPKAFAVDWSPDGRMLATTTATPDEEAAFDPGPAQIWSLAHADLERRMCEIAGGPATPREWRRFVDPELAPRPLCPRPSADAVRASGGEAPVVAFRQGERLLVGDSSGAASEIGRLPRETYLPVSFAWSEHALAWVSAGELRTVSFGGDGDDWWPCPCSGAVWRDGAIVALAADGRALHVFRPGRSRPRSISLDGPVGVSPTLLGFVGEDAIVAGYEREPDRSTPAILHAVSTDGKATRLPGTARGLIVFPERSASTGEAVAFVVANGGGVCFSTAMVGMVVHGADGRLRMTYPPMPPVDDQHEVRGLRARADGTIEANIAPIGCEGGEQPDELPEAERYELRDGRWEATGDRAYATQAYDGGTVVQSDVEQSPFGWRTQLRLRAPDGRSTLVSEGVDQVSARP